MRRGKKANHELQDKHLPQLLIDWLSETFWFSLNVVFHPIETVLTQLKVQDDRERFKEAFRFLAAMLALWFVAEIPMFLNRGIKSEVLSGFLFFVVYLVAYFLVAVLYALILHLALRVFRVRSDLQHTVPCYFYTGVAIPLYAILSYPSDIMKYRVIDRAGTIEVLLRPAEYSLTYTEVLQQSGRSWGILLSVAGAVVFALSILVFVFLSVILSKWYRTRYLRCLGAIAVVYVVISIFEQLVLEPLSVHIEVLFAKGP